MAIQSLSNLYSLKTNCERLLEATSVVLFEGSPQSPRSYVRYIRHASSAEYRSMSYIRRKDPPPRFFPLSLSNLLTFLAPWAGNYSLRSDIDYSLHSGIVRNPRAYLFSPLKISPEAGEGFGWSCRSRLNVVIVYVVKDIANKSAALLAVCHFGQEVR